MKKILLLLIITISSLPNCSATSWFSRFFGSPKEKKSMTPTPPLSISSSSNSLSRSGSENSFSSTQSDRASSREEAAREEDSFIDPINFKYQPRTNHSRTPSPKNSLSSSSSSSRHSSERTHRKIAPIIMPKKNNDSKVFNTRRTKKDLDKYLAFPVERIMKSFELDKSIRNEMIDTILHQLIIGEELRDTYFKKDKILYEIERQQAMLNTLSQKIQTWQRIPQKRKYRI